MILET